jgi:hypothetical protein
MDNSLWKLVERGIWQYTRQGPRWVIDTARIIVRSHDQWQLYINNTYIATFDSWVAARDATPMMITLHGIKP